MGMAASQARFLQLTARKTNIEYMGQQINQQRLALANASAGLFEKMLTLTAPVPPSSLQDKYYKQGYTFTDNADSVQKTLSWSTTDTANSLQTFTAADNITITDSVGVDHADLVSSSLLNAGTVNAAAVATALGIDTSKNSEGYTQVVRYIDVNHSIYDTDGKYQLKSDKAPALLEFDNLNRLIGVTLLNKNIDMQTTAADADKPETIGKTSTDALTYGGVFDNAAFNNDMNKYEFEKTTYDYQVERINQETKIIQAQDKSLELKMEQLDTEHNALQTEMDAVQKVIQKNVEGTFKTFA